MHHSDNWCWRHIPKIVIFQHKTRIQVHYLPQTQISQTKILVTRTMYYRMFQQKSEKTEQRKRRNKKNEYFGNLPSPKLAQNALARALALAWESGSFVKGLFTTFLSSLPSALPQTLTTTTTNNLTFDQQHMARTKVRLSPFYFILWLLAHRRLLHLLVVVVVVIFSAANST